MRINYFASILLILTSWQLSASSAQDKIIALQQVQNVKLKAEIARLKTKSCFDIKASQANATSGVYFIYPGSTEVPLKVYCEMEANGGGWTLVWKMGNLRSSADVTPRENQAEKLTNPNIEEGAAKFSDDLINIIKAHQLENDNGYWVENLTPTCSEKKEGFVSAGCRFSLRADGVPRDSACAKARYTTKGTWLTDSYSNWCQQTNGTSVFCMNDSTSGIILRSFGASYDNTCAHTYKNTRVWVR